MAKPMSDKIRKMLGQDANEHIKTCFTPANHGTLPSWLEFEQFWNQVGEEKKVALNYLEHVGNMLLGSMEQPNKHYVTVHSLINTLQFMALYINFRYRIKKKEQVKFLQAWEATEKKDKNWGRMVPATKDVVRTLQRVADDEKKNGSTLIAHLTTAGSVMHSAEEFKRMAMNVATFVDSDINSGEASMIYPFLKEMYHSQPKIRSLILAASGSLLRTLPQQVKISPLVAQTTLLGLLTAINGFLCQAPLVDHKVIQTSYMRFIQEFYLWPNPFGKVAADMLRMFNRETMLPGQAFREHFMREVGVAEVEGWDDEIKQKGRPAYWFLHGDDMGSMAYARILGVVELEQKTSSSAPPPRAITSKPGLTPAAATLMAMNIMNMHTPITRDEEIAFRMLPPEEGLPLHEAAVKIVTDAKENCSTAAEAAEQRAAGFMALKNTIKQRPQVDLPTTVGLPRKLPEGYTPPLPPIAHLYLDGRPDGEPKYTSLTADQLSMMQVPYTPFPTTPFTLKLNRLLEGLRGSVDDPLELRIIMAGGNETVHSFVCAYAQMLQDDVSEPVKRMEGVKPAFYLIPTDRNWLASFLARHDAWYNRHVYVPFRQRNFVVPWLSLERSKITGAEAATPGGDITMPGQVLRSLAECYVREAKQELNVKMWQIEGWTRPADPSSSRKGAADTNIPCLMSFELGRNVDARQFKASKIANSSSIDERRQWEDTSHGDVVRHKDFVNSFTPPDVAVAFHRVDMYGRQERLPQYDEGISFAQLLCTNFPVVNTITPDSGPLAASPQDPWMEILAVPHQRKTKGKSILMNEPQQHVATIDVTCVNASDGFHIEIDGQPFGPYHRVRLSPLTLPEGKGSSAQHGEQLSFPIRTFFPVDTHA